MIGYEARARITADVAGFVAAQRDGAQAATGLSNAVQALNSQLVRTENLATQAAASLRSFSQAAQQTNQRQGQAAGSATTLAQAMNQGAAAYNAAQVGAQQAAAAMAQNAAQQQQATQATNQNAQAQKQQGQSLKSLGQELARLIPQQQQFRAALAQGATLTREQGKAAAEVDQRLGQLTQQYVRLSATQRQTVNSHRDMAMASRLVTQATQEQSAAQIRLEQTGRLTNVQLQQLGRETAKLAAQRERLESSQRQGVVLNQQEANSLGALQGRLRELSGIYDRLSAEQKQVVTTARQLAQANQAVSASAQQAVAGSRAQQQAAEGLNGSLWSLRSAVGDATSSMQQLWGAAQQSTRMLWENYSAQEMAIAQISRVSQATVSEMDGIVNSVRQMSTEIPIAFEELGRIAMLGSQVGVVNESLGIFTETVALFAATSEISADETASLMARIMEMTKLNETRGQDAVQNLGSAVAYLGSNALATDREILKNIESIATMTTQVGMSAEATIGLASAMASLVIKPEIARGASQRVFLQLGEAVQGSSEAMHNLVEMTGLTQDELNNLRTNDYDSFFLTIMKALHDTAVTGDEELIPMIRELGIINSRDAEVVARLATNYNLLERSISDAGTAFADGQYLYEESDRIFNTLTARVQVLSNTWSNFLFSAAEAVAPFVTKLVEVTTNVIQMADSMGAAPILGWGAVVLGIVGSLGLLASGIGVVGQGLLSFVGLWNMWTTRAAAVTAANTAAAVSTRALATAQGVATTTGLAQAAALTGGSVAAGRFSVAMATATTSLRAFALAHPVLLVGSLVAMLGVAAVSFGVFGDAAERAERKILSANQTHIDAAGGMKALSDALAADTEVWREAQEEIAAAGRVTSGTLEEFANATNELRNYSAYRVISVEDMAKADKDAATEARQLSQAQEEVARGIESTSEKMDGAAGAARSLGAANSNAADGSASLFMNTEKLNSAVEANTKSYDENIRAVGTATRDWAAAAVNSALLETAMWESADALKEMASTGASLETALTMELNKAGDGAAYLRNNADELRAGMGPLERELNAQVGAFSFLNNETGIAANSMDEMADTLEAVTLSIDSAEISTANLVPVLGDMAEELGYSTEELSQMDDAALEAAASTQVLDEAVTGMGLSVNDFVEALASFIDPLGGWTDGLQAMNDNLDEGDASFTRFIDNGVNNFDTYLSGMYDMRDAQLEWSTNLLELGERVPPQVIGDLAAMGQEGAGLVADLVDATDEQVLRWVDLWEQGGEGLLSDYAVIWESFRVQAFEGGDAGGLEFVNSLMGKVAAGDLKMSEAVDQMIAYAEENFENADPEMDFYADNTEAISELNNTLTEVRDAIRNMENSGESTLGIDANGNSAKNEMNDVWSWFYGLFPGGSLWLTIMGNAGPAKASISNIPKRKDGGWVDGPGGPRQDIVPLMASSGEYVVNAASAARNAQLLEWINNDGNLPNRQEFVPQIGLGDNMRRTAPASSVRAMPDYGQSASAGVRRQSHSERIVVNVKNYYPQAEPTSVTTNRALQYVAGLNGVL